MKLKASILAAGDVMVHSPQLKAQYDPTTNTYTFDNNFKYVKKYVEEADLSVANLETTLAGNDVHHIVLIQCLILQMNWLMHLKIQVLIYYQQSTTNF